MNIPPHTQTFSPTAHSLLHPLGQERSLGNENRETLATVQHLADLTRRQGHLNHAKTMFMRALAGREKVLGKAHPDTLATLGTLAELMQEQVIRIIVSFHPFRPRPFSSVITHP